MRSPRPGGWAAVWVFQRAAWLLGVLFSAMVTDGAKTSLASLGGLEDAVFGDGVEWRSSELGARGSGELCCGQPCKNCTHPQAFSTRAITLDSSARGMQFRCDGGCLVGLTSRTQSEVVSKIEFAMKIDGAVSSETCTVKVVEKGVTVDMSAKAHQSGLAWPLTCDANTEFQLWVHRNGKVQYAINSIVFHESTEKPRAFPMVLVAELHDGAVHGSTYARSLEIASGMPVLASNNMLAAPLATQWWRPGLDTLCRDAEQLWSTVGSTSHWFRIDLGVTTTVDHVLLWNRGDCCSHRLSKFEVRVTDDADAHSRSAQDVSSACGGVAQPEVPAANDADSTTWKYSGFKVKCQSKGRYVHITKKGSFGQMHICNVQVIQGAEIPRRSSEEIAKPKVSSMLSPKKSGIQRRLLQTANQAEIRIPSNCKEVLPGHDTARYCTGSWTLTDLRATGEGSATAVCGRGWHICARDGDVEEIRNHIPVTQCHLIKGKFVSALAHAFEKKKTACDAAVSEHFAFQSSAGCPISGYGSEPLCCGTDCSAKPPSCAGHIWANGQTWTHIGAGGCGQFASSAVDGIMCCPDSGFKPQVVAGSYIPQILRTWKALDLAYTDNDVYKFKDFGSFTRERFQYKVKAALAKTNTAYTIRAITRSQVVVVSDGNAPPALLQSGNPPWDLHCTGIDRIYAPPGNYPPPECPCVVTGSVSDFCNAWEGSNGLGFGWCYVAPGCNSPQLFTGDSSKINCLSSPGGEQPPPVGTPEGYTCGSSATHAAPVPWTTPTVDRAAAGSSVDSYAKFCDANPGCQGFSIDTQDQNVPTYYAVTPPGSDPGSGAAQTELHGFTGRYLQCRKKVSCARNTHRVMWDRETCGKAPASMCRGTKLSEISSSYTCDAARTTCSDDPNCYGVWAQEADPILNFATDLAVPAVTGGCFKMTCRTLVNEPGSCVRVKQCGGVAAGYLVATTDGINSFTKKFCASTHIQKNEILTIPASADTLEIFISTKTTLPEDQWALSSNALASEYLPKINGRCQRDGTDYPYHYTASNNITEADCKAWCDQGRDTCWGYSWRALTNQCAYHMKLKLVENVPILPSMPPSSPASTFVAGYMQSLNIPNSGTTDTAWQCHPRLPGSGGNWATVPHQIIDPPCSGDEEPTNVQSLRFVPGEFITSFKGVCRFNNADYSSYMTAAGDLTETQCKAWCVSGGDSCVGYTWKAGTSALCYFHMTTAQAFVPNHAKGNNGTSVPVTGTAVDVSNVYNGVPNSGSTDSNSTCHPHKVMSHTAESCLSAAKSQQAVNYAYWNHVDNSCKTCKLIALPQTTNLQTSDAVACEDGKFGMNFCSEWCNTASVWNNCGTNLLPASDASNTDNVDYRCSCAGCNGCAGKYVAPGISQPRQTYKYSYGTTSFQKKPTSAATSRDWFTDIGPRICVGKTDMSSLSYKEDIFASVTLADCKAKCEFGVRGCGSACTAPPPPQFAPAPCDTMIYTPITGDCVVTHACNPQGTGGKSPGGQFVEFYSYNPPPAGTNILSCKVVMNLTRADADMSASSTDPKCANKHGWWIADTFYHHSSNVHYPNQHGHPFTHYPHTAKHDGNHMTGWTAGTGPNDQAVAWVGDTPHVSQLNPNPTDAWCPSTTVGLQWVQFDLKNIKIVTGIATQGRSTKDQWVRSYTVQYSHDNVTWSTLMKGSMQQTFSANFDRNTIVTQTFDHPIAARYVRVAPKTWHGHPAMRVRLTGCSDSNHDAVPWKPIPPRLTFTGTESDVSTYKFKLDLVGHVPTLMPAPEGYVCGSADTMFTDWTGGTVESVEIQNRGNTMASYANLCNANKACKGFSIDQDTNIPTWYTTAPSNPIGGHTKKILICRQNFVESNGYEGCYDTTTMPSSAGGWLDATASQKATNLASARALCKAHEYMVLECPTAAGFKVYCANTLGTGEKIEERECRGEPDNPLITLGRNSDGGLLTCTGPFDWAGLTDGAYVATSTKALKHPYHTVGITVGGNKRGSVYRVVPRYTHVASLHAPIIGWVVKVTKSAPAVPPKRCPCIASPAERAFCYNWGRSNGAGHGWCNVAAGCTSSQLQGPGVNKVNCAPATDSSRATPPTETWTRHIDTNDVVKTEFHHYEGEFVQSWHHPGFVRIGEGACQHSTSTTPARGCSFLVKTTIQDAPLTRLACEYACHQLPQRCIGYTFNTKTAVCSLYPHASCTATTQNIASVANATDGVWSKPCDGTDGTAHTTPDTLSYAYASGEWSSNVCYHTQYSVSTFFPSITSWDKPGMTRDKCRLLCDSSPACASATWETVKGKCSLWGGKVVAKACAVATDFGYRKGGVTIPTIYFVARGNKYPVPTCSYTNKCGTDAPCDFPKQVSPEFLIGLKTGPNYECSMKKSLLYDGTGTGMFTIQPDMKYAFSIASINAVGTSPFSKEVSFITPPSPFGWNTQKPHGWEASSRSTYTPQVKERQSRSVALEWEHHHVMPNLIGYRIQYTTCREKDCVPPGLGGLGDGGLGEKVYEYLAPMTGRCQKNKVAVNTTHPYATTTTSEDFNFKQTAAGGITLDRCRAWCNEGADDCVGYSWQATTSVCAWHMRNAAVTVPASVPSTASSGMASEGFPDTGSTDTNWQCYARRPGAPFSGGHDWMDWREQPNGIKGQKGTGNILKVISGGPFPGEVTPLECAKACNAHHQCNSYEYVMFNGPVCPAGKSLDRRTPPLGDVCRDKTTIATTVPPKTCEASSSPAGTVLRGTTEPCRIREGLWTTWDWPDGAAYPAPPPPPIDRTAQITAKATHNSDIAATAGGGHCVLRDGSALAAATEDVYGGLREMSGNQLSNTVHQWDTNKEEDPSEWLGCYSSSIANWDSTYIADINTLKAGKDACLGFQYVGLECPTAAGARAYCFNDLTSGVKIPDRECQGDPAGNGTSYGGFANNGACTGPYDLDGIFAGGQHRTAVYRVVPNKMHFTGLIPGNTYAFRVAPITDITEAWSHRMGQDSGGKTFGSGKGILAAIRMNAETWSTSDQIRLPVETPDSPPTAPWASNVGATTFTISWHPPYHNGKAITGYVIQVTHDVRFDGKRPRNEIDKVTYIIDTKNTKLTYNFAHPQPSATRFYIRVGAVNGVGAPRMSQPLIVDTKTSEDCALIPGAIC